MAAKKLTTRQRARKAQRRAHPVPARSARAPTPTVRAEPKGVAAREAVRDDVLARERGRLLAAVAAGDLLAGDIDGDVVLEQVTGAEMVAVDRRGDRQARTGIRVKGRDGIAMLHKSKALTDELAKAAMAFRICYELGEQALGSCLGRVGEGRGARDWSQLSIGTTAEGELTLMQSAADLHRAYVIARLNQLERAVFGLPDVNGKVWLANPDGRELSALRHIAGEGKTVREVAGCSGHARAATVEALVRALMAVAGVLRITGQ